MWPFNVYCNSNARLVGRTIVVTGANTGIGKETARDFYRRGARVIFACRDLKKAQEAIEDVQKNPTSRSNSDEYKGEVGELRLCKLNLSSLRSVQECAADLLRTEEKIHILVNNAGVMFHPFELTEDGFEQHLQVNYIGHFLLTLLLLPRIRESSPRCRIINVSSDLHYYGGDVNFKDLNLQENYSPLKAYMQSKLANVLFSTELAAQLKAKIDGINTYALHPGVVRTELGRYAGGSWLLSPLTLAWRLVRLFIKNAEQGSQTTIHCAVDETAANETGLYYSECRVSRASKRNKDPEFRMKLWKQTCKLLNLEKHDNLIELMEEAAEKYRTREKQ